MEKKDFQIIYISTSDDPKKDVGHPILTFKWPQNIGSKIQIGCNYVHQAVRILTHSTIHTVKIPQRSGICSAGMHSF